jgi:glycosyltransferase involved in cell wall biosynthesis
MKIALVHDFLFEYAGSERVVEQILKVFPSADLFTLFDFLTPDQRSFLQYHVARTTFLQNIPFLRRSPSRLIPFVVPMMPLAIEGVNLTGYDLVLSSSHSVAKGIITGPDQLHIAYIHSPMRYAWDLQATYLQANGMANGTLGWIARLFLHYLRAWDVRSANGVDDFIANSHFVARRVWKAYHRESTVIYPPVNVTTFPLTIEKEDFYLVVSRLVPYKRVDLIVDAFRSLPKKNLIVAGTGPELKRLRKLAGPNVRVVGYQDTSVVIDLMRRAKAFIMASIEDFGIAPVEAQASGTPVIAYRRGGAAEIVRSFDQAKPTGVFFNQQNKVSLVEAILEFETSRPKLDPQDCRDNALRFRPERFREQYLNLVMEEWQAHTGSNQLNHGIRINQESWIGR